MDKAVVITCITSDLRARNHTRPALGTDWTRCRSVPLNHQPIARQFRRLERLFPKPFERVSATRTNGSKGTLTWAFTFVSSRIVLHYFTPLAAQVRPKRDPTVPAVSRRSEPDPRQHRVRFRNSITAGSLRACSNSVYSRWRLTPAYPKCGRWGDEPSLRDLVKVVLAMRTRPRRPIS